MNYLLNALRGIKHWALSHKLHALVLFFIIQALVAVWLGNWVVNWSFYLRFAITVNILTVYIFFLFVKQVKEVKENNDVYTPLRRYILTILILSIITLCPLAVYQALISFGYDSPGLRNFISIVGGINQITTTILMVLIFSYRIKGE
jgi:hypothetical protein